MAVTYVGIGTVANGTGAITPGLPSGLADDDLLIAFFETANQAITLSGWTELASSPQGTGTAAAVGAVRLTAFYKFYTTGDSAPTSSDSGNHQIGRIMAFRGVDTTTPIEDTAGATAAASNIQNLPTVTSTSADAMAVYLVADDRDIATTNTQFRDANWTSPNVDGGSCTEVADDFTTDGVGGGVGAAYKAVTTPATLSSATFQHAGTNSFANGMIAIVLKPASGSPPPLDITPAVTTATLLAPAASQTFTITPVVTTATALAPSFAGSLNPGLVSTTATVLGLTPTQVRAPGLISTTAAIQPLVPIQPFSIGLITTTAVVLNLTTNTARTIDPAVTTATVLSPAKSQQRAVGRIDTTVSVLTPARSQLMPRGFVSTTASIQPLTWTQLASITPALVISQVMPLYPRQERGPGLITVTSTVLPLAFFFAEPEIREAIEITLKTSISLAEVKAPVVSEINLLINTTQINIL